MNYNDYQNKPSSEKITLAILQAKKRLMGWSLHSGSVYKLTSFDMPVIVSVKEQNTSYTEVDSLAEVDSSKFYHDKENQTLYLQASDDSNPNSKFIHVTRKFFFSNVPVTLPFDLNSGEEVYFEPQVKSTSQFGVEMDTVDQQNEAIEGSGQLILYNDQDFWRNIYDKYVFDNQVCQIYSWTRGLDVTEAKKLFDGKIETKDYKTNQLIFKMTDKLGELKGTIPLNSISELNLDNDPDMDQAKQRMIFGKLEGFRPVNVDVLKEGEFTVTGTLSGTGGSATITGSGTEFLTELNPEDQLTIDGVEYTINSISSDTSLTLTENVEGSFSGETAILAPDRPKRYKNRIWKVAGHALRQPEMTIDVGSSTSRLFLSSTQDLYAGDTLYIGTLGSGEQVVINEVVNESTVTLATSLAVIPAVGTQVIRPAIQNVRLDKILLRYYRDYTIDAENATLTLRDTAELDAAPVIESIEDATFTNSSSTVTGTGTSFKSYLENGYVVRPKGQSKLYKILSVDSDTQFTLTEDFVGTTNTTNLQYKTYVFDNGDSVLTCEVLGRTIDGTTSGSLLKTAPDIVKTLLTDANLEDSIDESNFTTAQDYFKEDLAFAIPEDYDDDDTTTYREVINKVNKSVFGLLIQNTEFQLTYEPLRPVISSDYRLFRESDILDLKVKSTNKNMIKTSYVKYNRKEYDYNIQDELVLNKENTSDTATYILGTNKTNTYETYLTNEDDANRLGKRWLFLLESSTAQVTFSTKLQGADLNVNDIICIEHRKMYTRLSGTSSRKYLATESIKKSGDEVTIVAVDLSNAFNRVALISDSTQSFSDADEDTRALAGFITDEYGLIGNDSETFGINLIW